MPKSKLTAEQYLADPCGVCSTAFWKDAAHEPPENLAIVHQRELPQGFDVGNSKGYFRLIHRFKAVPNANLNEDFTFRNVDYVAELDYVADILNRCYGFTFMTAEDVEKWTDYRVFDGELWVWVVEKSTGKLAALGIADFDHEIGEGSLEWIQVVPEFRKSGLGRAVVCELLGKLHKKADFVTVSGETENPTNPETLYRNCGFTGEDVWYLIFK